ncbi:MAG: ATP-binding protein [Bacteroidota bacterium]
MEESHAINPFRYGGVVPAEAFCNRTQEVHDLTRACKNADRLFVYAERRMGKTSLVKQVLGRLPADQYVPVYIDLWPTDSTTSFVITMAKALTEAAATRRDRLLDTARNLFSRLQPSISVDETGAPSLQFGLQMGQAPPPLLESVLATPPAISQRLGRRVVIVFDEFQQIEAYEDRLVERVLRSAIQMQNEIAYLFLGSRKHLIEQMFADRNRPLYRSAGHYPLTSIALHHWTPFIEQRFGATEKAITPALIKALCTLTDGHPFYTQHLAHAVWERTPLGEAAQPRTLDEALAILLRREGYAFATRWETLTRNQQRFLRGLAASPAGTPPFSSYFVQTYGLRTPSNAQRAANSLLKLDLIDREDGSYVISDRFFKLWIRAL